MIVRLAQSLVAFAKTILAVPPVFTDGATFLLLALFTYLQAQFGSDEAAKYIAPMTLFWTKTIVGACASLCLALKLFRSTSYANHITGKAAKDFDTQQFTNTQPPKAQ